LIVFHAPNHTLTSGALQIRTWDINNNLYVTYLCDTILTKVSIIIIIKK